MVYARWSERGCAWKGNILPRLLKPLKQKRKGRGGGIAEGGGEAELGEKSLGNGNGESMCTDSSISSDFVATSNALMMESVPECHRTPAWDPHVRRVALEPFWQRKISQPTAIPEYIASNACHAVRNRDRRQSRTVKRRVPDVRHAIRDRNRRQLDTIGKSISFDTRHAVRNHNRSQPRAAGKGITRDARHAIRDRDRRQPGTPVERFVSDVRHAIRNRNRLQPGTIDKRIVPDARHSVRNRNRRQFRTSGKRKIRNACPTIRKSCRRQRGKWENADSPRLVTLSGIVTVVNPDL